MFFKIQAINIMIFINNQTDLDKTCEILRNEKILYMDTEFYRRRTYYSILSIVQISTKKLKIVIDALAGLNLNGLRELLLNPEIIKVFHSPDQDFDIFLNIFGKLPVNIFDTQIAASICGMEEGMGYSRLCKMLLNIEVDKSFQVADWLKRPLSHKMLEYAIRDTEFLIPLHRILSETLTSRKLWDGYNAKSSKLIDVNNYYFSPEKVLHKMKLTNQSPEFMNNLLHFILFREQCARKLNIPRYHCAKDYELLRLCTHLPTNLEALKKLRLTFLPLTKPEFRPKLFELCEGILDLKS